MPAFFIREIVLRRGVPYILITDRGTVFSADLMQEIVTLTHTNHRKITAYHPQINTLTERLNRTMADLISIYVDVEHKSWDEILPYVTFAYNAALQETSGFTQLELA